MLSARRGKPVLLYFGSADLPDWNAALPNFQKIHEVWLKNGLQFVPVDVAAAKPAGEWAEPRLKKRPGDGTVFHHAYGGVLDRALGPGLPTRLPLADRR